MLIDPEGVPVAHILGLIILLYMSAYYVFFFHERRL